MTMSAQAKGGKGVAPATLEGDGDSASMIQPPPPVGARRPRRHRNRIQAGTPTSSKSNPEHAEHLQPKVAPMAVTSSGGEREAHRCLFNEDVLENIFKFIISQPTSGKDITRDVRSIRLVCKFWKDTVTQLYRRCGTPASASFTGPDEGVLGKRKVSKLAQFVATMRSSSLIPVQRVFLTGDAFFRKGNLTILTSFLHTCGPEIVQLSFSSVDISHVNKFIRKDKGLPDWNLSKLKRLDFDMTDNRLNFIKVGQIHGIANLLGQLMNAATTLVKFQCYCTPLSPFEGAQVAVILGQVGETLCRALPKTVKSLRLHMNASESTLTKLAEKGLELETFELGYSRDLGGTALKIFLESQAGSLKNLHLSQRMEIQQAVSFQLPPLHELVELTVVDGIASLVSFAEDFPKLECLRIPSMRNETFLELLPDGRKGSPALRELHLPDNFMITIAPLIQKAAECFPNIRELHVPVGIDVAETLEEVFSHFVGIEKLHITFHGKLDADSVLNGMDAADCQFLRERLEFWDFDLIRLRPSILNLTRLKKLVLMSKYSNISLTDISANFAFLRVAELQELQLIGLGSQISARYIIRLEDKLILKLL